jgi:hypothetical protein
MLASQFQTRTRDNVLIVDVTGDIVNGEKQLWTGLTQQVAALAEKHPNIILNLSGAGDAVNADGNPSVSLDFLYAIGRSSTRCSLAGSALVVSDAGPGLLCVLDKTGLTYPVYATEADALAHFPVPRAAKA